MAIKVYRDGTPFTGVIGRTTEESSPAWPEPPRPPEGAPNVLFFVLDDVGYGQLSSFGGLVETPVLDRVAANGLRYTNMHTTALCSPSRGCILTGRNHHSIGLASITALPCRIWTFSASNRRACFSIAETRTGCASGARR